MDQVVFVFDLEQMVPLEEVLFGEESLLEARLNSVKQAVLRILLFCTDKSKRNWPSFGFR